MQNVVCSECMTGYSFGVPPFNSQEKCYPNIGTTVINCASNQYRGPNPITGVFEC